MSMKDDTQFNDEVIREVREEDGEDGGFSITVEAGFSFFIKKKYEITPKVGDKIRFYGKGFGYRVRGISINNQVLFYQSEEDFQVSQKENQYGKTSQDWLDRWDAGTSVWSVEMGGLGPGYEQCIQIIGAETLRILLDMKPNFEELDKDKERRRQVNEEVHRRISDSEVIKMLGGVTGAQVGAGVNIASCIYRRGPVEALSDPAVNDRRILVEKTFPNPY